MLNIFEYQKQDIISLGQTNMTKRITKQTKILSIFLLYAVSWVGSVAWLKEMIRTRSPHGGHGNPGLAQDNCIGGHCALNKCCKLVRVIFCLISRYSLKGISALWGIAFAVVVLFQSWFGGKMSWSWILSEACLTWQWRGSDEAENWGWIRQRFFCLLSCPNF